MTNGIQQFIEERFNSVNNFTIPEQEYTYWTGMDNVNCPIQFRYRPSVGLEYRTLSDNAWILDQTYLTIRDYRCTIENIADGLRDVFKKHNLYNNVTIYFNGKAYIGDGGVEEVHEYVDPTDYVPSPNVHTITVTYEGHASLAINYGLLNPDTGERDCSLLIDLGSHLKSFGYYLSMVDHYYFVIHSFEDGECLEEVDA
ncbi:hypothetical protein [Paenibacillus glucanolyticus]|uniref:hypothetical protein n=1 Tax=Paenibacillus glucanolyticus TaxID=59843 RepID=UPI00096FBACD|nr:hypothetical protein [Paenibacillus glucanolyticus]OMF66935.1 hypothetical protein BK142_28695 [Paenibacillus glucanolyticus]